MIRTKEVTSRIMSKIYSRDTKPEKILRKELWNRKLRYKINYRRLPGSPDIVFISKKVAIFIDGDFWHGNNWRLRKLKSRAQEFSERKREYWLSKIMTNIKRDKRDNSQLKWLGWTVLRYWESDIKKDKDRIVKEIIRRVKY